jgi:hypothetical protein
MDPVERLAGREAGQGLQPQGEFVQGQLALFGQRPLFQPAVELNKEK